MRVKYTIEIKGGEQDGRIESGETGFLIALAGDTNKHGDLLSEKIHVVGPASMQDILQITMGFVEAWTSVNEKYGEELQKLMCVTLMASLEKRMRERGLDDKLFGTDISMNEAVEELRKAGWGGHDD